jgi:hypothetical protein
LFAPERYPFLEEKRVGDRYLADVLRLLCYRENGLGGLVAFDYAGLGERHLGSIYEGLLEHHFVLTDGRLQLVNDRGERKALGAYYTPQAWVTHIVENTLHPLLEQVDQVGKGNPTEVGSLVSGLVGSTEVGSSRSNQPTSQPANQPTSASQPANQPTSGQPTRCPSEVPAPDVPLRPCPQLAGSPARGSPAADGDVGTVAGPVREFLPV